MKKYISGFVLGSLLTISISVAASSDDLIGKVIQNILPVIVNGEEAEVNAIVAEGISYIPTRSAGEMLGSDVDFKDGQIILTSKVDESEGDKVLKTQEDTQVEVQTEEKEIDLDLEIKKIEDEIFWLEMNMKADKLMLLNKDRLELTPESVKKSEEFIKEIEEEIAGLQKQKTELEAQQP